MLITLEGEEGSRTFSTYARDGETRGKPLALLSSLLQERGCVIAGSVLPLRRNVAWLGMPHTPPAEEQVTGHKRAILLSENKLWLSSDSEAFLLWPYIWLLGPKDIHAETKVLSTEMFCIVTYISEKVEILQMFIYQGMVRKSRYSHRNRILYCNRYIHVYGEFSIKWKAVIFSSIRTKQHIRYKPNV